jgi:outer membrane biosynthesis protein TonB
MPLSLFVDEAVNAVMPMINHLTMQAPTTVVKKEDQPKEVGPEEDEPEEVEPKEDEPKEDEPKEDEPKEVESDLKAEDEENESI